MGMGSFGSTGFSGISENRRIDGDHNDGTNTVSGNVKIAGNNNAQISSVSGNVRVLGKNYALINSVSGDIELGQNIGTVSTISGDIDITGKNLGSIISVTGNVFIQPDGEKSLSVKKIGNSGSSISVKGFSIGNCSINGSTNININGHSIVAGGGRIIVNGVDVTPQGGLDSNPSYILEINSDLKVDFSKKTFESKGLTKSIAELETVTIGDYEINNLEGKVTVKVLNNDNQQLIGVDERFESFYVKGQI